MALGTPVIGTAIAGAGSTLAVAYPASVGANDQLLMICVMKPASVGGGTFTPPAGWTTFVSLIDKGGYGSTVGSDVGNMNLFIAAKDALAAGGETGTLTATLGGNGVSACAMVRVPTGGGKIAFDGTGGEQTTGSGSISLALAANLGIKVNDLALWAMAIPTDVTTPSQFSAHGISASGATFGSATELVEFDSTTGNDIGGYAAYAACSAGASTSVPTVTATAGGTTTNVRGPLGLLVVREALTVFDRANKNPYISLTGFDLTIFSDLIQVNGQGRIRSTTTKGDNRYTETLISTVNAGEQLVGVCNSSLSMGGYGQYDAAFTGISTNSGAVYVNGSYAGAGPTFGAGDIVSQQIDPANGIRWRVNGGTWSSWFALPSGSAWYLCAMLTPLSAASARQVWKVDSSAFTYTVPSGSAGWDDTGGGGTPVGRADETDTAYALTAKQIRAIGVAAEADTAYSRAAVQIVATGRVNEADSAFALSAVLVRATGRADEADSALALGRAIGIGRADEADTALARVAVQIAAVGRANEADTALALAPRQIGATGRADEVDAAFALGQPSGVGRADETDTAFALAPKQVRAVGLAIEADTAIALGRAVGITRANEADSAYALAPVAKRTAGRADETDSAIARSAVQVAPVGRANETDYALTLTSGQSATVGLAIEADTAFARTPLQVRVVGRSDETDTALALLAVQKRTIGLASETDAAFALAPVSLRSVGAANENDEAFALNSLQLGVTGLASEIDTALALFPSDYVVPPVPASRRLAGSIVPRHLAGTTPSRSLTAVTVRRTAA